MIEDVLENTFKKNIRVVLIFKKFKKKKGLNFVRPGDGEPYF
tara:strand:- start:591 stop:716 length:126 start_codon:yes stop_codon:yes gene_type:complete